MLKHISKLNVRSYRGIQNLILNDFGDINILLGDNNCGKTSVLEAIQILSRPIDFDNIVFVARSRERFRTFPFSKSQTIFNSFLNMFDKTQESLEISLGCEYSDQEYYLSLEGKIIKSLMSHEDSENIINLYGKSEFPIDEEVDTFDGVLSVTGLAEFPNNVDVRFNKYSRIARMETSYFVFNGGYISTIEHIVSEHIKPIVKNKHMTANVVELLQNAFDKDILDLRILNDDDDRSYLAIDHRTLGYIPLSSFGDGIKKAISLAAYVATINSGVLLIDEFETSLHTSAMKKVFRFLTNNCAKKNIQLFLTTHSIEAVEKFLECDPEILDKSRVITLYKDGTETVARTLHGKKALEVKNDLGLELR